MRRASDWSRSLRLALAASVLGLPAAAQAQEPPEGPRIPAIHEALRPFVDQQQIAGAVTLVATPEQVVHLDAIGQADIEAGTPMTPTAIFWIASMTKPVTAVAVLMLQDQGKLSVEDPVAKYIPEFEKLTTADGSPARVTIRHLLTHTSGLPEVPPSQLHGITDLAGLVPLYVAKPVAFEPGSKWVYCQPGINTAARVVEVVSGQAFVDFLDQNLFGPLEMRDTTFYLNDQQARRLATSYRRTDRGTLEKTENFILLGKSPTSRDRFPAANGGLFSTATDYAKFARMLLNGGELNGHRILKPETVKLMTTPQTGELATGFTPGNAWGLGVCVIRQPQGVTAMLSPGTYGHGGAYGTQAWIDPVRKRVDILMVQRANFPNSDASDVRQAFEKAAAASVGSVEAR